MGATLHSMRTQASEQDVRAGQLRQGGSRSSRALRPRPLDLLARPAGDWALRAYARAAPYPRGTTVAQDFFDLGLIPADTDYRMFSHRHYGALPGIDVAFIFDGWAYHTNRDAPGRIRPGTLQAMGAPPLRCRLTAGPTSAPSKAAAGALQQGAQSNILS